MIIIESWNNDVRKQRPDLPENFVVYIGELVGGNDGKYTHVKYTGAEFDKYTKGPKKGEFSPRKMVKGTKEVFFVNIKDQS